MVPHCNRPTQVDRTSLLDTKESVQVDRRDRGGRSRLVVPACGGAPIGAYVTEVYFCRDNLDVGQGKLGSLRHNVAIEGAQRAAIEEEAASVVAHLIRVEIDPAYLLTSVRDEVYSGVELAELMMRAYGSRIEDYMSIYGNRELMMRA